MVVLLGIAFLAGVITAVSPCVLPVLPIVLAGGASGGRGRPYAIVAGLITMFVFSILFAAYVLKQLGLPEDLLRNVSIALLFAVAATLLFPRLSLFVERALAPLSRRGSKHMDSGFLLGCALGFAFVPCGGPILAYVSAQSATLNFGFRPIALAISYALGASVVLLAIALGGQRVAKPLRSSASWLRPALGVVVAVAALGLVFHADTKLQTALPNWTNFLQEHTENTAFARGKLYKQQVAEPVQTVKSNLPDYWTGAGARRRRPLVQLQAADDAGAARQGRADRLLDVFVYQLPAHASAAGGLGCEVPQGRARDRRRAHTGVRVRARLVERRPARSSASACAIRSCRTTTSPSGAPTRTSTGPPST